jgi:hypothetical protein
VNFAERMHKFMSGFSAEERQEIEQSLAYQEAANGEDSEKAERIACEIIKGWGRNKKEAKEDLLEKRWDRISSQFEE